jgi:hypothetical protein
MGVVTRLRGWLEKGRLPLRVRATVRDDQLLRGLGTAAVVAIALAVLLAVLWRVDDPRPVWQTVATLSLLGLALFLASADWTLRWLRILGFVGALLTLAIVVSVGRTAAAAAPGDTAVGEIRRLESTVDQLTEERRLLAERRDDARSAALARLDQQLAEAAAAETDPLADDVEDAARGVRDLLDPADAGPGRAAAVSRFDDTYRAGQASLRDERLRTAVGDAVTAVNAAEAPPPSRADADHDLATACETAEQTATVSGSCRGAATAVANPELSVAMAEARLAVARFRCAVLGRPADREAVTAAESALSEARGRVGEAPPRLSLVDALRAGGDALLTNGDGPSTDAATEEDAGETPGGTGNGTAAGETAATAGTATDGERALAPLAVEVAAWVALGLLLLGFWRWLERRCARQAPGPVSVDFVESTTEPPAVDPPTGAAAAAAITGADQKALFRSALVNNVSEPAAAPGGTRATPVTDLSELMPVGAGWVATVIHAARTLGTSPVGSSAHGQLFHDASERQPWRVLVRLVDDSTGDQFAVREVGAGSAADACRAAGYWAAGTLLDRSTRVPSWAAWSGETADALAAYHRSVRDRTREEEPDIPALERAVAAAPHSGLMLVRLASAYDLAGRQPKALALYARAVAAHPRYLTAAYRLATSLSLLADEDGTAWVALPLSERRRIAGEVRRGCQAFGVPTPASEELARAVRTQDGTTVRYTAAPALLDLAHAVYRALVNAHRPLFVAVALGRRSERSLWLGHLRSFTSNRQAARSFRWTAESAALVTPRRGLGNGQAATDQAEEKARERIEGKARDPQSSWQVSYNLACYYARRGCADEALGWLETALARPNSEQLTRGWLETDPDLTSLRQHPRFTSLLRALTRRPVEDDDA